MRVLGLSCLYHDAAAALVVDGQLIAAAEEERFSRIKHDFGFPARAIDFCLERAGLQASDLDLVVFYEKPFLKFDRILMSCLRMFPHSLGAFREGMLVWLLDKLWVRDLIRERLEVPRSKVAFCAHHLAHAASAYYASPFDGAALLTVDGVGEWASGTRGIAWDTQVELQDKMSYPHSLGLLYSAFTAFLGFEVNEGEYKVMGMAPYGVPRFTDLIFDKLLRLRDDGSFALNLDYLAYHWSATHAYNERFAELFGPPRTREQSNTLQQHYADIAASIQKVTEEVLVRQAQVLRRRTGHANLCMAGGVALNSVANARILRESGFERLFVQPAAGDGGGALGAALWGYHEVLGGRERFRMRHASWGQDHPDASIAAVLRDQGLSWREAASPAELYDELVERLTRGQVLGWHQGRFEWGPRALGHRSILADPRTAGMKEVVNARIKFREPFRPFAPSVLAERAAELFDLPGVQDVEPARYMLLVVPVRQERRGDLGAVTHVDGSARLQAVHAAESPVYHGLIERFGQATGVPVVLNTSFNLRGEPIVNTPAEAYSTFFRSDMDALVMGRFMVWRRPASENRRLAGVELAQDGQLPGADAPPVPGAAGATAIPAPAQALGPAGEATDHTSQGLQAQPEISPGKVDEVQPGSLPASSSLMARLVAGLLVLAAMLLVTLGSAELVLRWTLPNTALQVGGMYRQGEEHVELVPGWKGHVHTRELDAHVEIDAQGYRKAPLSAAQPGASSVLVLGDSFTFGCWEESTSTWTQRMQQALGSTTQVTALGRPSAGTADALALLRREGPRLHPKVVVLAFYNGNDFFDNWLGPQALGVERGFLIIRDAAMARLLGEDALAGTSTRPVPVGSSLPPLVRSLVRHTALYQMVAGVAFRLGSPPDRVLLNTPQAWFAQAYTPAMQAAVATTRSLLDEVLAESQRCGARLVLVSIPSGIEVDDEEWAAWSRQHPSAAARMDRRIPEQLLSRWAAERRVSFLPLRPAFAGRERMYYRQDIHWTHQGHLQAGEKVADLLRREGAVP